MKNNKWRFLLSVLTVLALLVCAAVSSDGISQAFAAASADAVTVQTPTIEYSQSVVRGQPQHLVIHPNDAATWFDVNIFGGEEDTWNTCYFGWGYSHEPNETVVTDLSTVLLPEGHLYRVMATSVNGPDMACTADGDDLGFFTVEAPEEGAFLWTIQGDEFWAWRDMNVEAYCPDPQVVGLFFALTDENGDLVRLTPMEQQPDGLCYTVTTETPDYPGTFTAFIMANTADDAMQIGDPIQLTVQGVIMAPMELEVPATVAEGKALEYTIHAPENAERLNVGVYDHWGNQVDFYTLAGSETHGRTTADKLSAEGSPYMVTVDAIAEYFFTRSVSVPTMVTAAVDENITLTLNGDGNYIAHTQIDFTLNAPGASFVRLYWDSDDWFEDIWPDERGFENLELSFTEFGGGHHIIYARACYDALPEECDPDTLNFGAISNPIRVYCNSWGRAIAPALRLGTDYIRRGEMLPVTIIPQDDTNIYDLRLCNTWEDENGELQRDDRYFERFYHYGPDPFTVYVPTGRLDGGPCLVNVIATMPGMDWGGVDATFITEYCLERVFDITAEEVPTLDGIGMMVYAPGTEDARLLWKVDGEVVDWNYMNWQDGFWTGNYTEWRAAEYQVTAQVLVGGEWYDVDTKTVRYTAEGDLSVYLQMPDQYFPEEDLYLVYGTESERVDTFYIRLVDAGWNEEIYSNFIQMNGVTEKFLRVPADMLQLNHVYRFEATALTYGWNAGYEEREFLVTDGVDENIYLGVSYDGSWENAGSEIEATAHEELRYHISAPGASFVRLYINADDWRDLWLDGSPEHSSYDNYTYTMDLNGGEFRVFARACYDWLPDEFDPDEVNLSSMSQPVKVTVYANGDTDQPGLEVADQVTAGEFLPVTIIPGETGTDFHIHIRDEWNNEEYFFTQYTSYDRTPFTVQLPTGHLGEGSYFVWVDVREFSWNWTDVYAGFTVTEPGRPTFTADALEVETLATVQVNLRAPGAEAARMLYHYHNETMGERNDVFETGLDNGSWYNTMRFPMYYDEAILSAEVRYPGDETWYPVEDQLSFTIISRGALEAPVLHVPETLVLGDDLEISFEPVDNAEEYELFILDPQHNMVFHQRPAEDFTYRLPADWFRMGWNYYVEVDAKTVGMDVSYTSAEFSVTVPDDQRDMELFLTLEDGSTSMECPANADINLVLNAPGNPSFVRIFCDDWVMTDVWNNGIGYLNRPVRVFTGGGSHVIYAKACYDEFVDWDNLNLGGMSNLLNVTCWSNGWVTPPDVELEVPETVGDLMKVTIHQNQDGYVMYGAYIRPTSDNVPYREMGNIQFDHDGADTFEVMISTAGLQPGMEYSVVVDSYAVGYDMYSTVEERERYCFTMENDAEPMTLLVSATDIMTHDNVRFDGRLPDDACDVRLYVTRNGGWMDERWVNCVNGWCEDTWSTDTVGVYEVFLSVQLPDGEWINSDTVTIHVGAEGELASPVVHYPEYFVEGQDLHFSFEPVENAEGYNIGLESVGPNAPEQNLFNIDFREASEVTLRADLFQGGEFYRIHIRPYAYHYASPEYNDFIDIYTHYQNEQPVSLTIDPEYLDVPSETQIPVVIHAPGASMVRLYHSRWWFEDYWLGDVGPNGFDSFTIQTSLQNGYNSLFIKAFYDLPENIDFDLDTWANTAASDAIGVVVHPQGRLDMPVIQVPAEAARNSIVPITITPVEGAARYTIFICTRSYQYYLREVEYTGTEPFTVEVPVAFEGDFDEVWFSVEARADGYLSASSVRSQGLIRVLPAETDAFLNVPETALINERILISGLVQGSRSADWNFSGPDGEGGWGDYSEIGYYTADIYFDLAGDYTVILEAMDESGNVRSQSAVISIVSEGTLEAPELTCEPLVQAGQDVTITIGAVENAEWYKVMVIEENSELQNPCILNKYTLGGAFTIPAEILKPDSFYSILVFSEAIGYERGRAESFLAVAGEMDSNITLLANGSQEAKILCNENLAISITAPGAKAVCMRHRDYVVDYLTTGSENYDPAAQTWTVSYDFSEDAALYAQAYYGSADAAHMSWEELEQLPFGGYSNYVAIHVIVNGTAVQPQILHAPDYVKYGGDITVELKPLVEGQTYLFYVQTTTLDGVLQWDEVRYTPDGLEPFTISIPTGWLRPGTGRYVVQSYAPGMRIVTSPIYQLQIDFLDRSDYRILTLPAALSVIEQEAFRGTAAEFVVLPGTVTAIESRAFADSPIRFVQIPASVQNIAEDAFDGCDRLIIIAEDFNTYATAYAEAHSIPYFID